jgi:hypothetical protein
MMPMIGFVFGWFGQSTISNPRRPSDEPQTGVESGGGPPHSKTPKAFTTISNRAKRLGVRQSSGAFSGAARTPADS